jgi:hypothetical protein
MAEGLGNVEREGMGEEKLDNAVYTIRGYADLADMAKAIGDNQTRRWAIGKAQALLDKFEDDWWYDADGADSYADSLDDPGNEKVFQRHWIGLTPLTLCCLSCRAAHRRPWHQMSMRIPRLTNTSGRASRVGWDSSIPAPGRPPRRVETPARAATRWFPRCLVSGASSRSTAPSQRSVRATSAGLARISRASTSGAMPTANSTQICGRCPAPSRRSFLARLRSQHRPAVYRAVHGDAGLGCVRCALAGDHSVARRIARPW